MLELKLTDEERELCRSYDRKKRKRQLHLVTLEERAATSKYQNMLNQLKPMQACIVAWRKSAKARGIEWSLSDSYLLALMSNTVVCPVLGLPLVYGCYTGSGSGKTNPAKASLDRIDSSKPYTEDNVQIVSWAFNNIKSNFTDEQLLLYCKSIVNHLEDKNNGILG